MGYIYDFNIYTGKAEETPELGVCTQAAHVIDLVESLKGDGHIVYTDSYYTSPKLFKYLLERGSYACGTCKPS